MTEQHARVGAGGILEISVSSTQFFCDLKTTLKKKNDLKSQAPHHLIFALLPGL